MKVKYKRKDNNFSQETKELFIYNYRCWKCGKNNWDDNEQIKYDIYYDSKEYNVIYHRYYQPQTQAQTQIGFLKSKENCKEIISKFKIELDIIRKVK